MVNIDKLLKSFENLRVFHSGINSDETLVAINKSKPKDSNISKKDKIFNCNVIAESISSSQLKSSPEFPKFLSLSIELFLSLCDDAEPDVRIVADECLNKIIKSLLDSNVSRLQVELYKEIKKNDASRSLRAALMKFSDLCHLIRPQKCRPYVVNLLPCLMKISQRNDEGIQECLASSMLKICSVLMSFATELETKMLMKSFLSNVKSHSAMTRRTAAISLTMICIHSRKPYNFFLWLLNYLIDHLSSSDRVTDTRTLHGLLIVLRHLLLHFSELTNKDESSHCHDANLNHQSNVFLCNVMPSCHQLLKVLHIILQYSSHVDHNITNASLECLLQFIKNVHYQFLNLLLIPGSLKNILTEEIYFHPLLSESDNVQSENLKNPGPSPESLSLNAESLGDLSKISDITPTVVGHYNDLVLDSGNHKAENVLIDQENEFLTESFKDVDADDSFLDVSSAIQTVSDVEGINGEIGKLNDDKEAPIIYLVRFLCSKFLLSGSKGSLISDRKVKVSIKVLAVHCLTSLVQLHPNSLRITLHVNSDETSSEIECQYVEDVLAYASHSDPQLKGNIAFLIGSYISTKVSCKCTHGRQKDVEEKSVCEIEKLLALLMELYDDESSVAARCSLRAFQVSLPVLLEGHHADSALNVLLMLLKLKNNCYWLIKVELLQLLSILNLQTLFYLEKLIEQKRSFTYIKNLDIQDLITDVIIGLLGDDDARVRQASIRAICKIIPQLYYPSDNLHSCSLTSKAVGMVSWYLPGRPSDNVNESRPAFPFYDFQSKPCNVEVSHQMESSLSRVVTRVMKSLNQSANKNFTLGCCSALRQLSEEYPVHKFVGAWLSLFKHPTSPTTQSNSFMSRILSRSKSNNGIASTTLPVGHNIGNEDWSTTLVGGPLSFILSTLTSSAMSQDGYFHSDALRFAGNLFVGTAVHNFKMSTVEPESSQTWCSLSDKYLALLGDRLFVHTLRVLNIYFHIIEDVPASAFQTKTLPTPPSLSPIKRKTKVGAGKEESSQVRTPSSNQDKSLGSGKEPPKDGLGSFINIQHYVQFSTVLKSAYTSFKISSDISSDKFLLLLRSALVVLSQQLELATLNEVSRCADEILIYLSSTFTLDPSASLLCVKQLLKSIFGTNMAASPDAPSIITNQQLHATRHSSTFHDFSSLYNACFKLPSLLFLNGDEMDGSGAVLKSSSVKKLSEKLSTISLNKLFSKTEKSSVATYIKLFEPLVIKALKQYTLTSLVNVQLQVLDLLTTLVQLRVNYCLLDSDQIFIGFVLKQVEMIETGQIKAPEGLLPQIFNFLIHLSFEKYHNKAIITMPKVIQLCDGIMASELDQLHFTIPCLKHIVANLFGTNPDSKSDPKELETQREVVVSMLLRLLKYCEVLGMVCLVLKHSKTEGDDKHNKLSRQISDHIFPMLVKQEVLIENSKDFLSVLQLIECMSPCVFRPVDILINVLFSIPSDLTEVSSLCSWMVQVLCCLRVFMTISEEDVILFKVKQTTLSSPLFVFANCSFFSANEEDSGETILTKFILHAVEVVAFQMNKFSVADVPKEKKNFLCQEMFQLLLLIENMLSHHSHVLEAMKIAVLSVVPESQATYWSKLTKYFWDVRLEHPIIFIHWSKLSLKLVSSEMYLNWWSQLFHSSSNIPSTSANEELIRKTGFILLCHHVSEKADANMLEWLIGHNLQNVIQMFREESVKKLVSIIHEKEATSRSFCDQIKTFFTSTNKFQLPLSFIRSSLQSIETAHSSQAGFVLSLLTTCFLPTCHPSISRIVDRMICHSAEVLLAATSEQCEKQISYEDVVALMKHIEMHSIKQSHLMSLMLKLVGHLSKDRSSPTNHEDHLSIEQFNKNDFMKLVQNTCFNANYDSHECSLLLLSCDYSFVSSILMSEECNPCLLKSCIQLSSSQLQSIQSLSEYNLPNLSRNESHVSSLTQMFKAASFSLLRNINKIVNILPAPYKFFEYEHDLYGSVEKVVNSCCNMKTNQLTITLAECLEAYLNVFVSGSSSVFVDMKVDVSDATVRDICRFCIFFLESTHRDMKKNKEVSMSKLLLCLSCMNLALSNPKFHLHFSSPDNFLFICSSVHIIHSLLSSFVARQSGVLVKLTARNKDDCLLSKSDEHDLTIRTCDLMSELVFSLSTHLSTCRPMLDKSSDIPPHLKISFRKLIIELARMPLVNSYARTPTVVWNMGWTPTPTGQNKTKLPPIPLEFLQEKDVLSEFVFRVNSIGWTNRQQFEETWMSLLAVLNPVQHSTHQLSQEELLERTHCQILSIRSITSLLLSCTLSPHPGNPSSSLFNLKPRNKFQAYFTTSNGQKLLKVKTKLEMELWKIMSDNYLHLHQHNLIPLMNNSEREIGDFSYYPGQFSSHFIMSMINTLESNFNGSNVQQTVEIVTPTDDNVSDPLNQQQDLLDTADLDSGNKIIPPVVVIQEAVYSSSRGRSVGVSHDIDVHSCVQFLLELYGSFLCPSSKTPLHLINETVRSILLLSDIFTDQTQYEWMLITMLDLTKNHPHEDELLGCYVILATCKAAAIVGLDSTEKITKLIEWNLRSTHLPTKISTLYGGLYILEASQYDVARAVIPHYVDYLLRSLSSFTPSTIHSQQHALVMWSLSFYVMENYYQDVEDMEFPAKFFQICMSMMTSYQDSTPLPIYVSIMMGLERLAVSGSIKILDLDALIKFSTDRFCQQNTQRSLIAFNLMVTCMYMDLFKQNTASEDSKESNQSDTDASMKIMERVTVIFDRTRKGMPNEAAIIMKVLPTLLMDFFEGHEIMNKIIGEFLNNQQPQTQLFAQLLFQIFNHLMRANQSQLVINWVMLSLSNFTQRTPISMAVWSLTCVFICSSTNPWLRSIYPMVLNRAGVMEAVDCDLFCASAIDFYTNLVATKSCHSESFLQIFQSVASYNDSPYQRLLSHIQDLKC